jgi:hypothetical protein
MLPLPLHIPLLDRRFLVVVHCSHNLDAPADLAGREDHGVRPLRIAHLPQRLPHVGSAIVFDLHEFSTVESLS